MYKKVIKYIKTNGLINEGDRVLVAFSGGPDSVCLLNMLNELKEKFNIEVGAVHINHMLRGEEADIDEEYVKEFCQQKSIPCYVKRIDIKKYSKEKRMSSETAGRKARYDFFEEISQKENYNKIATAHNANDQAETVLFRMIRGSGIEGLGGIKNFRDNKIIRPILCLSREEVELYIKNNNLKPRIDKTNFERDYNRNKIRLDILPYIKKNFNENIIETLNRMSLQLQKDNQFLEEEALKIYKQYCANKNEYFIIKRDTFSNNEAIVTRVIRKCLINYSKQNFDFEMKHIYEIIQLFNKETGKVINMPNGIIAENIYGDIILKKNNKKHSNNYNENVILRKDLINDSSIIFGDYEITFNVLDNNEKNKQNIKKDSFTRYFNFDKIENIITIRTRQNGDKIKPFGMKGSKKLKDVFINMKVPKELRDSIPIICFDYNIAYISGYKISEDYKVLNTNRKILKITVKRKE